MNNQTYRNINRIFTVIVLLFTAAPAVRGAVRLTAAPGVRFYSDNAGFLLTLGAGLDSRMLKLAGMELGLELSAMTARLQDYSKTEFGAGIDIAYRLRRPFGHYSLIPHAVVGFNYGSFLAGTDRTNGFAFVLSPSVQFEILLHPNFGLGLDGGAVFEFGRTTAINLKIQLVANFYTAIYTEADDENRNLTNIMHFRP